MTDSRYTTQAEKEAPQFQVVEVGGSQGYPQWIASCIQKDGIKTIGFEDQQPGLGGCTVERTGRKSQPDALHQNGAGDRKDRQGRRNR